MKKLLGIVVLCLLWCSFSIAGEMNLWKKTVKLPEDVSKGYKKGWSFGNNYDPETHLTPDYAFTIVNKSDEHPVRLGKQSIRFELRRGDCGIDEGGYNDCTIWDEKTGHTSERHELGSKDKFPSKGVTWHTYSIFLTKDFPIAGHGYEHISLGQFHGGPNNSPGFKWDVDEETYQLRRRTGCHTKEFLKKFGGKDGFKCSISMPENNKQDVILAKDLRGKWHDIVINIKWSRKKDGHFKQWINGKLVYHYLGNTSKPKGSTNNFKLGIYRGASNQTPKESTQIVYYDEIRYAKKSCKKLQLEDLGYSCEKLESQKIPNGLIDHIPGQIELELTSLPTMDGKYKLVWLWIDKTMDDKEIRKSFVIGDEVTIKEGIINFDKMNNSKVISNKYREKVSFINLGDTFMIKGSLDLDSSGSLKVTIKGSSTKNEKGLYVAEGLWGIDDKKKKKEYIGIFLKSLK